MSLQYHTFDTKTGNGDQKLHFSDSNVLEHQLPVFCNFRYPLVYHNNKVFYQHECELNDCYYMQRSLTAYFHILTTAEHTLLLKRRQTRENSQSQQVENGSYREVTK